MSKREYYDIIENKILRMLGFATYDKPKKKKLPKLQTRLSTSKKKANKLQRVQKKVRK